MQLAFGFYQAGALAELFLLQTGGFGSGEGSDQRLHAAFIFVVEVGKCGFHALGNGHHAAIGPPSEKFDKLKNADFEMKLFDVISVVGPDYGGITHVIDLPNCGLVS